MIRTVDEMYVRFLYGIDKEGTATVYPEKFNELINEAQGLVVNEIADEVQINRRRLDDLAPLYLRTAELTTKDLPINCFRELFVKFRIELPNGTSFQTVSIDNRSISRDFFDGKILRADLRSAALKNPYRNHDTLLRDKEVYYEILNTGVASVQGIDTVGYPFYSYQMDYIKFPQAIVFDETGANHRHCELSPRMQQIIVDRAVRIYIERTENVRYQSALNEDRMKNI